MSAFTPPFEPVALPDDVVRLMPQGELRRVRSVEPLGSIGPVDFGSVAAGSTATVNNRTAIEVEEAEVQQDHLGHYRVDPLSPVEIRVNQDNRRDDRFSNADQQGSITRATPPNVGEVYVLGDGTPYFEIENPNPYDLAKSYVHLTGFKYLLSTSTVTEGDVQGQPRAVPVDKLERRAQDSGTSASALRGD